MNTIELKRGDTLELDCVLQDGGVPLDITGWQIDSWVRAPGRQIVHKFAAVITAPLAGRYLLPATAVFSTQSMPVQVLEPETR